MGSTTMGSLVSNIKLSSVVPATATGENKVHELTGMDLAMKLHYIQGVYFFRHEAVQGLTTNSLKEPMFTLLDLYSTAAGRIRRSETGRLFIKCNDSGVRIVEAECDKTVDEFFSMNDHSFPRGLAHNQTLGPDLAFSPLVLIQFTRFKCGGISVGLSWAHVLGDAFSASAFLNMWGQILSGQKPPKCLPRRNPGRNIQLPISKEWSPEKSTSIKKVEPVGDSWLTANNCKMETKYFHVTANQLEHLVSKIRAVDQADKISHFEVISAIIWKCLAEIMEDSEPRIVTICAKHSHEREDEYAANSIVLSTVEADFSVARADISAVVGLIAEKRVDENGITEELLKNENGEADYVAYGANLTFVNLEEANIYGLELNGHRPFFSNYTINGVGDEGVVMVLPGPPNGKGEGAGGDGALTVTMVLPENQPALLKNKLERDWNIVI